NVPRGAASLNLCWLLDSDLKRPNPKQSFESALVEMGVGSVRFPYGFLANNYLWHTPPYDDVEGGLRPKVATMKVTPGNWQWAVNPDGSFTSAMDFDEYMALCKRTGIKPLVVVNSMSHKMEGGCTLETLVTSAAEWVRYALKKGYEVAYWQIGNEMDHHPKDITLEEYIEAYVAIASAMKEVDPDAYIGPGILGRAIYFTELFAVAPELVDFTSCHQYLWSFIDDCKDYELWSKYDGAYIRNVTNMQTAVSKSSKPDMEILITETGVSPAKQGMGNVNNTYKALWWFELLMSQLSVKNVSYSYNWGTHSPWGGAVDNDNMDVDVLLRIDDNSRKPTGEVVRFVNQYIGKEFVESRCDDSRLRVYAMSDDGGEGGVIYVMNKSTQRIDTSVALDGLPAKVSRLRCATLMGKRPDSRSLNYGKESVVRVSDEEGARCSVRVEPLSITTLRY
ncbi:MAG: hypothetical protein R3Y68_09115, partial [Rikenellaceae bacterium]